MTGHGEKLSRKQEALIAALLTEPTHAAAATKADVSEATLQRWRRLPEFQAAYRQARRELVEGAIGRIQAATGQAVDTLLSVARDGAKDGDRVRAAIALLDHAFRALNDADALHDNQQAEDKYNPAGIEEKRSEFWRALGDRLAPFPEAKAAVGNLLREQLHRSEREGGGDANG